MISNSFHVVSLKIEILFLSFFTHFPIFLPLVFFLRGITERSFHMFMELAPYFVLVFFTNLDENRSNFTWWFVIF